MSKILICLIGFVNVSYGVDLNDIEEATTCYAIRRSSQAFSRNSSIRRTSEAFSSRRSGRRSRSYSSSPSNTVSSGNYSSSSYDTVSDDNYSSSSYTTVRGYWRSTPSGGKTYVRSHLRRTR
jgi:hypothetical protein